MRSGLGILAVFVLGLVLGRAGLLAGAASERALDLALCLMLFLAGMGMGFDVRAFLVVRQLGLRALLLPLAIIAGSGLGGLCAWLALPLLGMGLELAEVLGVGAGFGYYSLSSVLIGQLHSQALGSVALIANISRELLTLLAAPLLVRFLGGLAPVATGGAASMDTCLPVIARCAGEQYAIMGVLSGMALTLAVPLLVTGIFHP